MTSSETMQYGKSTYGSPSTGPNPLLYLLIGGGVGAAAALFFAPKAGTELRSDISQITKRKYDETLEAANHLKQTTSHLLGAKDKTERAYEFGTSKIDGLQGDGARGDAGDAFQKSFEPVNGEILEISSRPNEKELVPPSSNIV